MSRMMPSRVRSQGIALYDQGALKNIEIEGYRLTAEVENFEISYDLDGQMDDCSCPEFQRTRRYCEHIAAIEEYLKHREKEDKVADETIVEILQHDEEIYSNNLKFLEKISLSDEEKTSTDSFSVEVLAEEADPYNDHFMVKDGLYFTLRLFSENLEKAYIIKDIPHFLKQLSTNQSYMVGINRFVDLNLEHFDEESLRFLNFLLQLERENDEEFLASLYVKNGRYLTLPLFFIEDGLDFAEKLPNFMLKITEKEQNYFTFDNLGKDSEVLRFVIESQEHYIELAILADNFVKFYGGRLLYNDHVFYRLNEEQMLIFKQIEAQLMKESHLRFPYSAKDKLAYALKQLSFLGEIDAPEAFKIRSFQPEFSFDLTADEFLTLAVKFDYDDFAIDNFHDLETLDFSRDLQFENKIFRTLQHYGFPRGFEGKIDVSFLGLGNFFIRILPAFEKMGKTNISDRLKSHEITELPEIFIDRNSRGLLDISFDLPNISDHEFANVIASLQNNDNYYLSENGQFYRFDDKFDELKSALQELDDNFVISGNSLTVNSNRSFQVSKIFENVVGSNFSEQFKHFYENLVHPETFPYEKPEHIKAELRPYQETGVRWMSMLTNYQLGGILADDMGLGKTVQAITFLLSNLTENQTALITAPASLVYNWASEFEKFTDEIDFIVIDGPRNERQEKIQAKHQIYITSYGSFIKDFADYQEKELTYLLLDEAQVIKNHTSKTNKALSMLNVQHTFALSGTPLENKIEEIWAIFQVIMPDFLPKRDKFNKMTTARISRMIQPFVMRRKKEDVLTELPEKLEKVLYNNLEEEQKLVYLAQLELMQQEVLSMDSQTMKRSKIQILAGITRLRQICNTPALFMENYTGGSGKLESLMTLLEQVKNAGHRPLIFSQFTKTFPFIEQAMEKLDLTSYRLTGSTPVKDRLSMVQAFNAGSRDAFLISLKAGGVGLNLTSADVVILVDMWWNPAVEEQAVARAHRMGQKNKVEVIRLITKGSIEERIMTIQERKKELITDVLDGKESAETNLSESEIREILGL